MGIRNFLKKQQQSEAVALGKRLLGSALGEVKIETIAPERVDRVLAHTTKKTLDELYADIGLGNQLPIAVARRLLGEFDEVSSVAQTPTDGSLPAKVKAVIVGSEGLLTTFAKCCRPIPGDPIAASASPGKGLNVHRAECRNIRGWEKEPGKYFPVKWDKTGDKQFLVDIRVFIVNKQGMLAKLTTVIASQDSNIQDLATDDRDSGDYVIKITLSVRDRIHLANVMRKIRVTPDVIKVYRRK